MKKCTLLLLLTLLSLARVGAWDIEGLYTISNAAPEVMNYTVTLTFNTGLTIPISGTLAVGAKTTGQPALQWPVNTLPASAVCSCTFSNGAGQTAGVAQGAGQFQWPAPSGTGAGSQTAWVSGAWNLYDHLVGTTNITQCIQNTSGQTTRRRIGWMSVMTQRVA